MLYKPNFCCHCGEKIERADWSPLTSRRFCAVCEIDKKPHDYLVRAIAAVCLILGIFGFSSFFGFRAETTPASAKGEQLPVTKRGIKSQAERGRAPGNAETIGTDRTEAVDNGDSDTNTSTFPAAQPNEISKQRAGAANSSTQTTYFCGAMTKKGTPCTRRVKTKGRCWQHEGLPAAEPAG